MNWPVLPFLIAYEKETIISTEYSPQKKKKQPSEMN